MPDMCETEMRVYGKRQDLEKFKSSIDSSNEDEVIDFNKIIPMPEDLSKWDKDKDGSGAYYWTIKHWGAKWGAFISRLTDKGDHLDYLFTTAWSPPFPIYETLIRNNQTLDFDIIAIEQYVYQCVDISSKKGNIKKYITWSDSWVLCVNNEIKLYFLKTEWVNGSRQVVKVQPQLY